MKALALAILLLILACASSLGAVTDSHVVIIVAGDLSIRDIAGPGLHQFSELLESSSVALMNVRAGRPNRFIEPAPRAGMEPGCMSIGAGSMATGGAEVSRAANTDGTINGLPVVVLYQDRTGRKLGSAQVAHAEIAKIQRINALASYHAVPGALGSALHRAGIRTAVIGNSDLPGEIHREAVAVAMDSTGLVDFGDVSSTDLSTPDAAAPYGMRANTNALLGKLDQALSQSRFIVMDYGDTVRADVYSDFCTDEQIARIRRKADMGLGAFVSQVLTKLNPERDLLILLSPNPRIVNDVADERLTPILIKGPGFEGGMLVSPSTRRPGLVTISDVAPTVLGFFGIQPPVEMIGRPVRAVPHACAADALLALNKSTTAQAQRQVAMRGSSVAQSVVVVLVTLCVLIGIPGIWRRLATWVALAPMALPLAMLYLPLIYSGGLVGAVIWLVVLTAALIALCAGVFRSAPRAFVWLCAFIVGSLLVDLMRGGPLTASSIGSYSVTEGARYYGIGNELMGTLLGASIMGIGTAFAADRIARGVRGLLAAAVFTTVLVFIAAPTLGAKAGGAAAVAPAVAVALLARRGGRLTAKGIIAVILFSLLAVGAMFAADAMRGSAAQSHVGRAASLAVSGGWTGLLLIAERKVAVNFLLLSFSPWSRLLGLALAGSAILVWWAGRKTGKRLLAGEEAAAALACCFGIAGAFAFNDAGVVAAGTCSVFLWSLIALRALALTGASKKPED